MTTLRPGSLVRVDPKVLPGNRPHFGRARLIEVSETHAVIKPFGRHRKLVKLELTSIRNWKSRNGSTTSEEPMTATENNISFQTIPTAEQHEPGILPSPTIKSTDPSWIEDFGAYLALRKRLVSAASLRMEQLAADRKELKLMMSAIDDELTTIQQEFPTLPKHHDQDDL